MRTHRRDFLRSSLAASTLVSIGGATIPGFLARSARAAEGIRTGTTGSSSSSSLLGGNDGLNTVVPHGDRRLPPGPSPAPTAGGPAPQDRPTRSACTRAWARWPGSSRTAGWRSSRGSATRTPTARTSARWRSGRRRGPTPAPTPWRPAGSADSSTTHPPKPGAGHAGPAHRRRPVAAGAEGEAGRGALAGADRPVPPPARRVDGRAARRPGPRSATSPGSTAATTRCSASSAGAPWPPTIRASGWRRSPATATTRRYPNYGLARRLEQVARIIKAGFGTRIYYTRQDGYDTHANQLGSHAALLTELSDSLAAFHDDLAEGRPGRPRRRPRLQRVRPPGRRERLERHRPRRRGPGRSSSGRSGQAGLIGEHPSFDDLDDGDLKFHTDFRRLYAAMLDDWLGVPSAPIVGDGFEPLPLLPGGLRCPATTGPLAGPGRGLIQLPAWNGSRASTRSSRRRSPGCSPGG